MALLFRLRLLAMYGIWWAGAPRWAQPAGGYRGTAPQNHPPPGRPRRGRPTRRTAAGDRREPPRAPHPAPRASPPLLPGARVTLLFGTLNLAASLVASALTGVAAAGRAVGSAAMGVARGPAEPAPAAAAAGPGPAHGSAAAAAAAPGGAPGGGAAAEAAAGARQARRGGGGGGEAGDGLLATGISIYVALMGSVLFFARAGGTPGAAT
jgi:hypothetical protein